MRSLRTVGQHPVFRIYVYTYIHTHTHTNKLIHELETLNTTCCETKLYDQASPAPAEYGEITEQYGHSVLLPGEGGVSVNSPPILQQPQQNDMLCSMMGAKDKAVDHDIYATDFMDHMLTSEHVPQDSNSPPTHDMGLNHGEDVSQQYYWFPRPFISHLAPDKVARIYDVVISGRTNNAAGARCVVPTGLNITAWELNSTGHPDDRDVLDGIRYGFPLQYRGGPLYQTGNECTNHRSAINYPEHIREYIDKELSLGTLVGPFEHPPFTPWCHVSPLMTRPKSDSHSRRVIVDLSYPDGGINQYILKNCVDGIPVTHKLPTIQHALFEIQTMGISQACMATIDISRAYRNFRTCPSDWPLLIIKTDDQYFIDTALPFGCRMSSYYMMSIANFIIRALDKQGIKVLIYLDDILIIGPNEAATQEAYTRVLHLLTDLGLPAAPHKLTPPSRKLVWLGIHIDLDENTISIPVTKLKEMRDIIIDAKGCTEISIKQMQSLIGMINHLGKAVPPARLFMCRLLDALRNAQGSSIPVDRNIMADISWFERYLVDFNGKAIIPDAEHSVIIEADACLTGMGAHDGKYYYTMPITQSMSESHSISRLECMNCLLAVRTLIKKEDAGRTILVKCDNESTTLTYKFGRARDMVMSACARAMWMFGASLNVNIVFQHTPGVDMGVADTFSRAYNSPLGRRHAHELARQMGLSRVYPRSAHLDYSSFL